MENDLLYKEEVFKTIGCAIEVYNELGPGFLESVYEEALKFEFEKAEIPCENQVQLRISYKGKELKKYFIADFIVFNKILIELKAEEHLTDMDKAQVINYLKATGLKLGLLINFGNKEKLDWKRLILTANSRE